jgi:hypothetical protein
MRLEALGKLKKKIRWSHWESNTRPSLGLFVNPKCRQAPSAHLLQCGNHCHVLLLLTVSSVKQLLTMAVYEVQIVMVSIVCVSNASHFSIASWHWWPPLWYSGQSSWLQIQRSRVWFLALLDFLRKRGSGTGSTQPREYNWGATRKKT